MGQKGVIEDGVQARWPPHPYNKYNSIWICPGETNLVSLPTFLKSRNLLKLFSEWKK